MEEDSYRICQYFGGGCKAIMLARDKLAHEAICLYRMCGCPYPPMQCQWQGRTIHVAEHLAIAHQLVVLQGPMIVFAANRIHTLGAHHWMMLQACFDNHFMLVLSKRYMPEGVSLFFAQAQLLGSRQKGQGFNCRIELYGRDGRRLAWEGKPRCIEDDVFLPDNATDCLKFDYTTAIMFAEEWTLYIVVTIRVSDNTAVNLETFVHCVMEADSRPCRYFRAGCTKVPLAKDKLVHEEMCDYRVCKCPYPAEKCEWQGRVSQVAHHLATFHGLMVSQGETTLLAAACFNRGVESHWAMLHSCFDNYFLLVVAKRLTYEGLTWCFGVVQLLGSKKKAEKFNYRMELVRADTSLLWEGKPRCVFDSLNVPYDATDCFILNYNTALMFAKNHSLDITVTIGLSE